MQQARKEEILAKKAKLAELKRQREQRQKEFSASRQSIGVPSTDSPSRSRLENRQDIDNLITSLVGEGRGTPSPSSRNRSSRPSSYASPNRQDGDGSDHGQVQVQVQSSGVHQELSFATTTTVYELNSDPPKKEIVTYSKQTQTDEWLDRPSTPGPSDEDSSSRDRSPPRTTPSRRDREREEQLRENIRKEIEEELKAAQQPQTADSVADSLRKPNFPARALTAEELDAVTASNDFLDFIDRSSKVIERALDEEYDVLADYRHDDLADSDDDEGQSRQKGRKGRRLRQVIQFYDERWSKKRMISDVNFSSKFPELALASYTKNPSAPYDPDGLVQVWNLHMHDRPEYIFQNTSDILTAKFSPFHPSLVFGGSYSGQVLLWDTRSRSPHPVQKTPLTGSGHTHPVYSLNIVGTQNAHNIISTSTDGVMCSWSVDMLSQPQEYLELAAPPIPPPSSSASGLTPTPLPFSHSSELAPTSTAFPTADPTYLLVGTESGTIHLAHRYDRAGARAGVDTRVAYRGHLAPVMSLDFHKASGPVDLGDLLLSSSVDWSVKVWRIRTPAPTSISAASATRTGQQGEPTTMYEPALDINRDDAIYDAKWSPVKPGVFACVDGSGQLEVWDLCTDTEVPAARASPSARMIDGVQVQGRALNRCAWETHEGKRIAVGGLDGVVSVFEVGNELGGTDSPRAEEWGIVKRLVGRSEASATGGQNA